MLYYHYGKTIEPQAAYPSIFYFTSEGNSPPDERKEGDRMNVTYSDLFQFCIFVVSLVGLCYKVFGGKNKK